MRKSILEKTTQPFRSCIVSSTVGIGYLTRLTAEFARLMSTQSLTLPLGFSTTRMGDIHFDGWSTFSTMSHSINFSSSAFTFSFRWNGIWRRFCIILGTEWSIWRVHCLFFSFPGLSSNKRGNRSQHVLEILCHSNSRSYHNKSQANGVCTA